MSRSPIWPLGVNGGLVLGNKEEQHVNEKLKQLVEGDALSSQSFVPDKLPSGENRTQSISFSDAKRLVDGVSYGKRSTEPAPIHVEQSSIIGSQYSSVKVIPLHFKADLAMNLQPVQPLSSTATPDQPVGILQAGNLTEPTPAPRVVLAPIYGNSKAASKVVAQRNNEPEDTSPQLTVLVNDPHFVLGISKDAQETE
jgi:hypothetical protein